MGLADASGITPTDITALVTSVGFPIVAAYIMWVFTRQRIEASEKTAERREEAAAIRESKLVERIQHLEDDIRGQLLMIVTKATEVIGETKEVMQLCSGTLAAVTVAMQDMKDEAKRGR